MSSSYYTVYTATATGILQPRDSDANGSIRLILDMTRAAGGGLAALDERDECSGRGGNMRPVVGVAAA